MVVKDFLKLFCLVEEGGCLDNLQVQQIHFLHSTFLIAVVDVPYAKVFHELLAMVTGLSDPVGCIRSGSPHYVYTTPFKTFSSSVL